MYCSPPGSSVHGILQVCPASACQTPLSIDFYRREYWSGLPFPSPGGLPDPGIKPWAGPLSKRKRRLDSLEAAQGAPGEPRRDSRGERSPWLPLETRPDSPGEPALRQTQRSPEGPRRLHRIPRLSEAPWERNGP